jgi:hypothetical protein
LTQFIEAGDDLLRSLMKFLGLLKGSGKVAFLVEF